VLGYHRDGRSLTLARLVEGDLVACGSAGSGRTPKMLPMVSITRSARCRGAADVMGQRA
jgi:hypothetical protein